MLLLAAFFLDTSDFIPRSTNGSKGWLEQPRRIPSWRCLVRENVGNCSKFHPIWHIFLKMSDCLLSHKLPTRKSTSKVRRYMYSIARTAPLQHLPNIFSLLRVQRAPFFGDGSTHHWVLPRGSKGDGTNAATFGAKPRVWLGFQ